jgi:hypothetical protein
MQAKFILSCCHARKSALSSQSKEEDQLDTPEAFPLGVAVRGSVSEREGIAIQLRAHKILIERSQLSVSIR